MEGIDENFLSMDFRNQVVFAFDYGIAVINESILSQSAINHYKVPILQGPKLLGVLSCKVTRIPRPYNLDFRLLKLHHPTFIGHRGSGSNKSGSRIRENTILSFNRAMVGTNLAGIELDVLLTCDRKLVIYHDLQYPVSINGRMIPTPIAAIDYKDMQGPKLKRRVSDPIQGDGREYLFEDCPLLDSVLKQLSPELAGIVIELKFPTNGTITKFPALGKFSRTDLVESVLNCLEENQDSIRNRWIVLSSFDPDIVYVINKCLREGMSPHVMVVHNTWFGHEDEPEEDDTVDFTDVRNRVPSITLIISKSMKTAIAVEAKYALSSDFSLYFEATAQIDILSYGADNMRELNIEKQNAIQGFFVDNMHLARRSS